MFAVEVTEEAEKEFELFFAATPISPIRIYLASGG